MNKTFNEGSATLHKHEHEPRTVGDIIQDMLRSNSPFARATTNTRHISTPTPSWG